MVLRSGRSYKADLTSPLCTYRYTSESKNQFKKRLNIEVTPSHSHDSSVRPTNTSPRSPQSPTKDLHVNSSSALSISPLPQDSSTDSPHGHSDPLLHVCNLLTSASQVIDSLPPESSIDSNQVHDDPLLNVCNLLTSASTVVDSHAFNVALNGHDYTPLSVNIIRNPQTSAHKQGPPSPPSHLIPVRSPLDIPLPSHSCRKLQSTASRLGSPFSSDHHSDLVPPPPDNPHHTPVNSYISRNTYGVVLKHRSYPHDYTGPFIVILTSASDRRFTINNIFNVISKHISPTSDVVIEESGKDRFTLSIKEFDAFSSIITIPDLTQNFKITIPSSLSEYIGVIKSDSLTDIIDDLLNKHTDVINGAYYICTFHRGSVQRTNLLRIHFHGTTPRTSVTLGGKTYRVQTYIHKIRICTNCSRYGHLACACRSKHRCKKCGNTDTHSVCLKSAIKCLACHSPDHLIGNKACPILQHLIRHSSEIFLREIKIRDLIKTYYQSTISPPDPTHSPIPNRISPSHPIHPPQHPLNAFSSDLRHLLDKHSISSSVKELILLTVELLSTNCFSNGC
ncbi:hypothetical protein GE061_009352 [Apolygus lucorum]|uniref:CCHC-type domain-containing protein n=1 Tax=Apolygus lucorum TaxID=248454 RepID=A0A8S9Y1F7_APOLU|nr:hypothetical protein GE061_009352 [Apolygus lucorum]